MKRSLTRNLFIGFGISLFILLLSSVASYVSIRNLLNNIRLVNHSNEVMLATSEVLSTLKDAETGQRGYMLTGEQSFLEPYNGSYNRALEQLNEVKKLVVDNPQQVLNAEQLRNVVIKKLLRLEHLIDQKKANRPITSEDLLTGKEYMDEARMLAKRIEDVEVALLKERTEKMQAFAAFTPILIIIASLLSLLVAVYFYVKIKEEITTRSKLQQDLQKKDQEISSRLDIIQKLADKISNGDYSIRITDDEKDSVGSLAGSLNKMAGSLEHSFQTLQEKEWIQASVATLGEIMLGEKNTINLSHDVLQYLALHLGAPVGAFYFAEADGKLRLEAGFSLNDNDRSKTIAPGEGIAGQVARQRKEMLVTNITEENLIISFASGKAYPETIIAYPVFFERKLMAVIELGFLRSIEQREITLLKTTSESIGIAINGALNRIKLQELLEETQAQAEELQAQHTELENMNAEMEAQTEKLQASEEELRVQQEELMETNQAVEERNKLLEDRNQLIAQRNLEIQKKAEELALSTKYKSEFLANMSHELRTPLNSILLLSRLMSENNEKNLSNDQVEYANVIQNSGNSLLELIDEILDLSKIEAGKMQLEYTTIPLLQVMNDMNMLFLPMAGEKKIEFKTIVQPGTPELIETDKMRLEQILKNLLSNAFKFTEQGYVHLTVAPSAEYPGNIEFTVKDTGIGIAKEKQRLIFEAFQQADGSTRRKYGGTGLGLSISRELSRLLKGDISVKSEPGQGSEFSITIPAEKNNPGITNDLRKTIAEFSTVTTAPSPESIKEEQSLAMKLVLNQSPEEIPDDRLTITPDDRVILIIEDDTAFAKALLEFTRKKGYKGLVSVRGDLGIDMAVAFRPAGILLDVQLPMKNGLEVIEELKSNPITRPIPVHIISSFDVKKESLSKGAIDFITKPLTTEKINSVFEKLEYVLNRRSKKVLIIEDNSHHAKALAYYLGTNHVSAAISESPDESMQVLQQEHVDCVILDMGIPDQNAYQVLDAIKSKKNMEDIPIIVFTGKNLSMNEEFRIKQYADSIVIKTAHSYRRILDELSIFLHLLQTPESGTGTKVSEKLGSLHEVLKNKRVLIADDDVRNIFSITKALEQYKMKVIPAMDGKEALELLEENKDTDIILMDIMMPKVDGFEAIARIKSDKRFKNIPIIAVTAKAMLGDREKCIQAGASDYISKPVDIDQLISLLRVWLYEKGF